jgi:hypothetical protein
MITKTRNFNNENLYPNICMIYKEIENEKDKNQEQPCSNCENKYQPI